MERVQGGGCARTGSVRAQRTSRSSYDLQLCRRLGPGSPPAPVLQTEEATGGEGG